tara:strand:- start:1062 stop:1295 length:234 start_codon:yes stop_codon:yes gene_type:complete
MSEETVETDEISYTDKQDYLIRFGYDPTNVKYMNTDILNQAYASAKNIEAAQVPTAVTPEPEPQTPEIVPTPEVENG